MTATVVTRRVAAVPHRTAGEAWTVVAALLATPGSAAHDELLAAAGPAVMLIAEEATAANPIVVTAGSGPRYRIYTLHGDAAISGDAGEQPLPTLPGQDDGWRVALPCGADDLDDVAGALAAAPHVTAYAPGAPAEAGAAAAFPGRLTVDRSQLGAT